MSLKAADLRIVVRECFSLDTRLLGPHTGKKLGDHDRTKDGVYTLNRNVTLERERR